MVHNSNGKHRSSCIITAFCSAFSWNKEPPFQMLSLFFPHFAETKPQLVLHERGANHATVWAGGGAGEAQLGGALPQLHGGARDARRPPAHRGQEAAGPVEALHGRAGDRRPGHGKAAAAADTHSGGRDPVAVDCQKWEYDKKVVFYDDCVKEEKNKGEIWRRDLRDDGKHI